MLETAFPVRLQSVSSPIVRGSLAYSSGNLLRDHRNLLWNWICSAAPVNPGNTLLWNSHVSGS
eukprot:1158942-Pelagomonas_calceolata.AAC.8